MHTLVGIIHSDVSIETKLQKIRDYGGSLEEPYLNDFSMASLVPQAESTIGPLCYAIYTNSPLEIIDLLLEKGADPYKFFKLGFSYIDGFSSGLQYKYLQYNAVDIYKLFKKYSYTNINKQINGGKRINNTNGIITEIVKLKYGNTNLLKYVLENFEYNIDSEYSGAWNSFSILLTDTYEPDLIFEKLKLLIEIGHANVNIESDQTPLHLAVKQYLVSTDKKELYYEIIKYLLLHGADRKIKDIMGMTPYQLVQDRTRYNRPESAEKLLKLLRQPSFTGTTQTRKRPRESYTTTNKQFKVFDFTEVGDIDIDSNTIKNDIDNIYFKVKDTYFRLPKDELNKKESLVFQCKKALDGAPLQTDVLPLKYYLIRATANYLVPWTDIENIGSRKLFELVYTGKVLKYTASYNSIMTNYNGIGLSGQQVNIVSADHCQEGSERLVYQMVPIEIAGGRRKTKHKKTRRNITKRKRKSFVK